MSVSMVAHRARNWSSLHSRLRRLPLLADACIRWPVSRWRACQPRAGTRRRAARQGLVVPFSLRSMLLRLPLRGGDGLAGQPGGCSTPSIINIAAGPTSDRGHILVLVHTERKERIQLISAPRATRRERTQYEETKT